MVLTMSLIQIARSEHKMLEDDGPVTVRSIAYA